MPDLEADIDGAEAVKQMLRTMSDRARYPRPAWELVADAFGRHQQQAFDTGGLSSGAPWDPLSPPAVRWKTSRGFDPRVLVSSGRLMDSLTRRPFGIEEFTPDGVTLGTDVEYAKFHQSGTDRMPARQLVRADPEYAAEVNSILERWIVFSDLGVS